MPEYYLIEVTCLCRHCIDDKISGKKILAARVSDDTYDFVYRYLSPVTLLSEELPASAIKEIKMIDLNNL